MVYSLLWFEIKNRLARLSSVVYFGAFFAISFFLAITFAGAFKGVGFTFGFSSKLALNSPVVLNTIISSMSYFGLMIIAPIFGQSINQDFESGFNQVLFATPIGKPTYFFVRFFGSFLSSLLILLSIGIGVWGATLMPFIDQSMILDNCIWFFMNPYLTTLIPNILTFGAIFLAVASVFKKIAPVYVASISIFTGYMISQNLTGDLDNKLIAALIEPFGVEGASQVIRYWSIAEQSTQVVPLIGNFLYNRVLWGAVGFLALFFGYFSFNPYSFSKERKRTIKPEYSIKCLKLEEIVSTPRSWKVFWQLSLSEFTQVFSNIFFSIILSCGILYILAVSSHIGKLFGTETLPVTYHVLEVITDSFSLFVVAILSYYAGELVWKDREQRVYELIDSKPISDVFLYFSKLISLVLVLLVLIAVILASCVFIQISKSYTHFEWNVYVQKLVIFTLPTWILASILALFIQTISSNKQIGHMVVVSTFLLFSWLPSFGLDHRIYLLGDLPKVVYSDMNRFGSIYWSYGVATLYWGCFYLVLLVLTLLLWKRGTILSWKGRISEFRIRMKSVHRIVIFCSLFLWIVLGGYTFYNTNVLNSYKTSAEAQQELVTYEKKYKIFEAMVHPRLVSVSVNLALFPERQRLEGKGLFKYQNNSTQPIQTIMVNVPELSQTTGLEWSKPGKLAQYDRKLGVRIYHFEEPILPGDEVHLEFILCYQPKGFTNSGFSKKVVENGSFFYGNDFFPVMGYETNRELSDDSIRKKHGLSEKPRMPDINDPIGIQQSYISHEGNWVDFEATISTSRDQIAIAPGTLENEWHEKDRSYFRYKAQMPILPFYAFLSGRYEIVRDQWNDVKVEIYHHPSHTTNTARMIYAVKKSLEYYTENFSPYQFKELRIIEFPRYESFAQSFPNTIPFSESIGFIAKVNLEDPENIDYPFYVTAHEVAHQWWGHQVIGGRVQGATMLSESLAQYSALMVMEKEYGPQHMKKFLKYELDSYLNGRSYEQKKELPLVLNENQGYIQYQKGSLAFYALKDYLGEETVNKVLRDYIKDVSFQSPPFTRAIDLVERFKLAVSEPLKYLIEDLFETITFYDNRTDKVTYKKNANDKFEVEVCSTNKKWRSDEFGSEHEIPMADFVDVGIYDQSGNLRYLQKHKMQTGSNRLIVEIDFQPSKAGVDPFNKLIDKLSDGKVVKALSE